VPEDKRVAVIRVALHCIINGPVGVNKRTTFPIVGETSIKGLVQCTNSQWRAFCENLAKMVQAKVGLVSCNTVRQFKTYWPLY
jgi:hypothetical protein